MIRILDKQTADKIAAGEVIERPVSIIKELVENSLDAGASSLVIEIRKGGKAYIRVSDDGIGIADEEAEKAFLRHATSKISSASDLEALNTLGFRGEALASVCAVSRTEMISKRREDKLGTRLVLHGGEVITHQPTGCPDGTTMIVSDLFYNTPARQKFLKSDAAESGLIIELVSELALAYQDVAFRLISNDKVIFATSGRGDRLDVISRVFPAVDTRNLTAVSFNAGGMSLTGYVSTPALSRTSRSGQIFFVNGRIVSSKVIERGLSAAYKERLFAGRYPLAFLFLAVDAKELDVNIHPNKRAVRFDDEAAVEAFVTAAVKEALGAKEAVVRAADIFRQPLECEPSLLKESAQIDFSFSRAPLASAAEEIETPPPDAVSLTAPEASLPGTPAKAKLELTPPPLKPFDFAALTVTGVIFNTYITAVDEDSFYLFDQHAAHERIFYEKLVGAYDREEKLSQPILLPIIIDVPPALAENEASWLLHLEAMGFVIDNFGPASYRITEIPTFMTLGEAEDFARDFIDNIDSRDDLRNTIVIDKLIMKSCKSAVKAHDRLSDEELTALIRELSSCVNPFSCPHGRPTFIRLTEHEIERLFKRV